MIFRLLTKTFGKVGRKKSVALTRQVAMSPKLFEKLTSNLPIQPIIKSNVQCNFNFMHKTNFFYLIAFCFAANKYSAPTTHRSSMAVRPSSDDLETKKESAIALFWRSK